MSTWSEAKSCIPVALTATLQWQPCPAAPKLAPRLARHAWRHGLVTTPAMIVQGRASVAALWPWQPPVSMECRHRAVCWDRRPTTVGCVRLAPPAAFRCTPQGPARHPRPACGLPGTPHRASPDNIVGRVQSHQIGSSRSAQRSADKHAYSSALSGWPDKPAHIVTASICPPCPRKHRSRTGASDFDGERQR